MPRLSTSEQRERALAPPLGTRPLDILVWYKPLPMEALLAPGSLPLPNVWGAAPAEVRVAVGTTAQALTVALKTLAVLWILQEMNTAWDLLDEGAAIAFLIQFVVDLFRSWAILALAVVVRRTPNRRMCCSLWPTIVVLSILSFGEIGSFVCSQVFYGKARRRWHKSDKIELLELATMGLLCLDLVSWLGCHIVYLLGEAPINDFLKEELFPEQVYVIQSSGALGRAITQFATPRPRPPTSASASVCERAPLVQHPPAQPARVQAPPPARSAQPPQEQAARPAHSARPGSPEQPAPSVPSEGEPDWGAPSRPPESHEPAPAPAPDRKTKTASATSTLGDAPPPYSLEAAPSGEAARAPAQTGLGPATETASMVERLPHLPERPREQRETLEYDWGDDAVHSSESDPNAAWRS